jgi:PTS system mannose-specific IIB component/D-glucosaminate-specific PTS system IIB component
MATINLARIDDRLIHGQVMQVWSKGHGTNAIFVVDDATASDEFMKEIYESTQSTGNMKIKVFSSDGIVEEWKKKQVW